MTLIDQIEEALRKLGSTANEVAENLYVMGYSGCTKKPSLCPIANYVMDRVMVTSFSIAPPYYGFNGLTEYNLVPLAISNFISLFDDGHYPKLIDAASD